MDLKQIRYFVALAETMSFTEAAKRLHITQPPLSRQIQALEASLGVTLIERDSRPMQLTEAGRLFYEQMVPILNRMEDIRKSTVNMTGQYQRRLSIGFAPSVLYGALPMLIRNIKRDFPDTELQFFEMTSMQQIEALKTGRIDVGFGRIKLYDASIVRQIVRRERLAVAMSNDHPLACSNAPLPLSALDNEKLLVYPSQPRPSFADHVLNTLHDERVDLKSTTEVSCLQTALGLVAAAEGLCIIPTMARIRQDIHYRQFEDDKLNSPIILSYRKNDSSWYIQGLKDSILQTHQDNQLLFEPTSVDLIPSLLTEISKN